ncbi:MAG: hypothetical protein CSA50_05145 [Gammaproteobacteria bacterium]|nr:MAG: hypothetical protein CSA50_05145 [Gammaproteobacteria bacterium]
MKSLYCSVGLLMAVVSASTTADLQMLADSELSAVRGQAGLSIELATEIDIGEIAYRDEGYIAIKDIHLGGLGGSMLDNMLITLDIAGPNEVLHRGFSRFAMWADAGLVDSAHLDVADAAARYSVGGSYGEAFNDGDMVLHVESLDSGANASNDTEQNIAAYQSAVDFALSVGSVGLTEQGYAVGSGPTGGAMFSDIDAEGYLGPVDIVIRNGSGATSPVSGGAMDVSDAVTEVDAYFRVTDLDLNWDAADVLLIFNFAAMKQLDVKINNTRGNDYVGQFGFAKVSAKFAEGASNINGVTGLAIYDVEIRADVDMPHVQFGNASSIGGIYFTDFVFQTDVLVYGH